MPLQIPKLAYGIWTVTKAQGMVSGKAVFVDSRIFAWKISSRP